MNLNKNGNKASSGNLELVPLKSALVNNNNDNQIQNFSDNDEEVKYGAASSFHNPNANHPSSSSLFEYTLLSRRTPVSKRLLSKAAPTSPSCSAGPSAEPPSKPTVDFAVAGLAGAPPSRRREERAALANLRKKVAPALLRPIRNVNRKDDEQQEQVVDTEEEKPKQVPADKRPNLLQRILSHRPVSMVVEWSEVRTAWQDSDFITECLCWHNVYRQRHSAPTLTMSPDLCDYAQTWANHLAHSNKFYYRNDKNVGQNLFQRPVNNYQGDLTGQEVSSYWYSAVRQYNYYKEPDVLHTNVNAGHFTQVVWVATRFFGVGKARSRAGKVIVVANYSPPGNTSGGFDLNVLPPMPDYNVPAPSYHYEEEAGQGDNIATPSITNH